MFNLTKDQFHLFNVTFLKHMTVISKERRKELGEIIKIDFDEKERVFKVYFENGEWFNYTLNGQWY